MDICYNYTRFWLIAVIVISAIAGFKSIKPPDTTVKPAEIEYLGWSDPMKCPVALEWERIVETNTTFENTEYWMIAIENCRLELREFRAKRKKESLRKLRPSNSKD
jgi:hypothetical protein